MIEQQDSDFSLVIQSLHSYGKQGNTNLYVEVESVADNYTELESTVVVTPEQIKITETEKEQVIRS